MGALGRSRTGSYETLPQPHGRSHTGSLAGSPRSRPSSRNRSNKGSEDGINRSLRGLEDDSVLGDWKSQMHVERMKSFGSELGISDDEGGPVPQTPVRLRVDPSEIQRDDDDY